MPTETEGLVLPSYDEDGKLIASVKIKEEEDQKETGGHFRTTSLVCNAPSGVSTHEFSFPYDIGLLSVELQTKGLTDNDEINFNVAPNTIIGTLATYTSAGQTEVGMSQTVIDNSCIGMYLTLTDGVNTEERTVISIDTSGNKITFEQGLENSFEATSPTYVKMTIKLGYNLNIKADCKYVFGESKIGASLIPANTVVQIKYNNTSTQTVTCAPIIEFLY